MSGEGAPVKAKALLRRAGLSAKKSWGQSFLCDEGVLRGIAEACHVAQGDVVVELGAGLGALTHHLLLQGCRVVAVERDRDLVPELRRNLADAQQRVGQGGAERLQILEANAATIDYGRLSHELGRPPIVAGNLPYQLSGRILVSLADAGEHVARAVLLLQREVAERLAAGPGNRTYGLLSVLVQRSFAVSIERIVPPGAFYPRPKVHSAVVRLERQPLPLEPDADRRLVAAARAAFSARRKTLRNALRAALHTPAERVEAAVLSAGLDPGARAETLDLVAFSRLAQALTEAGLLGPTDG